MTNRLFYGDNLDVLRRKIKDETVDLCYIDPPFNSKRNYFQIYNNQGVEDRAQAQAFVDTWTWEGPDPQDGLTYLYDVANLNNGKLTPQTVALIRGLEQVLSHGSLLAYIVHMTLRIIEIQRVLKPTGSFYLHCDPTASHYLKLVLDAVFCGQGGDYKNEIAWKRSGTRSSISKSLRKQHDVIFFYTKSGTYTYNMQYEDHDSTLLNKYTGSDTGGIFRLVPLMASGKVKNGETGKPWRGFDPNTRGKSGMHWLTNHSNLEQYVTDGLVAFPRKISGVPQLKYYLNQNKGVPVSDFWDDVDLINSMGHESLGYPTQKPEALLERIIAASSNEGDVVLDAYCGCGTTVTVSQKLNRKWIGIDITYQSISLILKRLQDRYSESNEWPVIEADILLDGVPRDLASAVALANRKDDKTRKEFEKWSVLTYSNNQSRINEKKGADAGIDGIAFFLIDAKTNGKAIFQVKSGGANRATVATLNSDRLREKAEFGFLITMDLPSKSMRDEIAAAGKYKHPLLNREDDRIQVITVADVLAGKRLSLPMARLDATRSAKAIGDGGDQKKLL